MKYVICKFRPTDSRGYTYAYDSAEPLAVGDEVKVPDKKGDGWQRVTVSGFTTTRPPFDCKAIMGKAPPKESEEAK